MSEKAFDQIPTAGCLFVGHYRGEVVVNHPDIDPDEDGVGHIVFSPQQARDFAALLLKAADNAEKELNRPF